MPVTPFVSLSRYPVAQASMTGRLVFERMTAVVLVAVVSPLVEFPPLRILRHGANPHRCPSSMPVTSILFLSPYPVWHISYA